MSDKKPKKPRANAPENPNDDWEDYFTEGPQVNIHITSCPAEAFDYERWKQEVIDVMCFGREDMFEDFVNRHQSALYRPLEQIEEAKKRKGPTMVFFPRYKLTGGTLEELRNPEPGPVELGNGAVVAPPTEEEVNNAMEEIEARLERLRIEAQHNPDTARMLRMLGIEDNNAE